MNTLIDWVIIFFLFFILNAIAINFLDNLNHKHLRELDLKRYIEDLGIMYQFPQNRG